MRFINQSIPRGPHIEWWVGKHPEFPVDLRGLSCCWGSVAHTRQGPRCKASFWVAKYRCVHKCGHPYHPLYMDGLQWKLPSFFLDDLGILPFYEIPIEQFDVICPDSRSWHQILSRKVIQRRFEETCPAIDLGPQDLETSSTSTHWSEICLHAVFHHPADRWIIWIEVHFGMLYMQVWRAAWALFTNLGPKKHRKTI